MKQHRLTAISGLIGGLLVVLPILGLIFGDSEDNNGAAVVLSTLLIVVGILMLAGLWWLREGRFTESVCLSLVGAGFVVFGVFFSWMVLIPTAVALILIWFGIVKRGLVAELRPASGT